MPTFNGEKYIKNQLDSLCNQIDVEIDLFVFDDNSTDRTLLYVEEYRNKLNIFVKKNHKNSGGTGKNILINLRDFKEERILEYKYFSLCDQDDVWENDKIKRAISFLSSSNASLYFSNLSLWKEDVGVTGLIKKDFPMKKFDYLFEGGSAGCTYVMASKYLLKINRLLQNYPIESKSRVSHDWLLYFLARYEGERVVLDNESRIKYRIHDNNQYGKLSFRKRFSLINNGFYITQIKNNLPFIDKESEEYKIYRLYMKSFISRVYVLLKYNFSLFRKKSKFIYFLFISLVLYKATKISITDFPSALRIYNDKRK